LVISSTNSGHRRDGPFGVGEKSALMYETPLLREWRLVFAGHWPPSELKSGFLLRSNYRLPGWLFPFSKDRFEAVALPGTRCLSGWLDADLSCRTSLALLTEQSEYR
jgi:hypothetical protein